MSVSKPAIREAFLAGYGMADQKAVELVACYWRVDIDKTGIDLSLHHAHMPKANYFGTERLAAIIGYKINKAGRWLDGHEGLPKALHLFS